MGYGVLAGFASGLAYNSVMSTMSKWFPDKQGLISGILLMGFGLGSFIIGKVYQAYTPSTIGGWRISFMIFGVILAVVLIIFGFFFVKPDEDFILTVSKNKKENNIKKEVGIDIDAKQMIKRSSFWFYFVWAILLSASGLALISQASGIVNEIAKNIDASSVATIVGLISICNGIGRVIYGGMFDKFGRSKTMITVVVVFLVSSILLVLAFNTKSLIILIVGFILCGASFGSTIAGMLYDYTGSYISTTFLMIGGIICSFICTICIKRP